MTRVESVLAGGVFGPETDTDDFGALRDLTDELGRRSFDSAAGRRRRPATLDRALWKALQDTGLARLTSAQDQGAGPAELAVVLYGLARHCAAVPLAETDLLAGWLAGSVQAYTPPAAPLTAALAEGTIRNARLTGTATRVPWTRAASTLTLIIHTEESDYLAVVDPSRVSIDDGVNLAGEPRDDVTFDLSVDEVHPLEQAIGHEFACRGAWARCVQVVGTLDAAVSSSVAHCRERVQFGRPLSRIQSVQQTLAAMAGEVERARAAATLAVAAAVEFGFDSGQTEYAVAVAKTILGPVVGTVTTCAHQLHGAIGTSIEHPLWLSTLRARSWVDEFGGTGHHARRLGRLALSSTNLWDCVTGWL